MKQNETFLFFCLSGPWIISLFVFLDLNSSRILRCIEQLLDKFFTSVFLSQKLLQMFIWRCLISRYQGFRSGPRRQLSRYLFLNILIIRSIGFEIFSFHIRLMVIFLLSYSQIFRHYESIVGLLFGDKLLGCFLSDQDWTSFLIWLLWKRKSRSRSLQWGTCSQFLLGFNHIVLFNNFFLKVWWKHCCPGLLCTNTAWLLFLPLIIICRWNSIIFKSRFQSKCQPIAEVWIAKMRTCIRTYKLWSRLLFEVNTFVI